MEKVSLDSYVEPIRKKWIYHFIISSKTNSIEKPEWYFEQTRKWIDNHIDIVDTKVRLNLIDNDSKCIHVKHKFILCFIELIMIRLKRDMTKLKRLDWEDPALDDDYPHYERILINTYNEVIQFTKTIRRLLGDCFDDLPETHDMLSVFDQKLFPGIFHTEFDYAMDNLKTIIESPNKWDPVLEGNFVDEYRVPICVDRFLLLIKSITDRIECFKQQDCQFELIDLQCTLFERMLKFFNDLNDNSSNPVKLISGILSFGSGTTKNSTRLLIYCSALNGVNFLRLMLNEQNFIPRNLVKNLHPELLRKIQLSGEESYKGRYRRLVQKVVYIYEQDDCDRDKFLNFIKPKLSRDIFQEISHETCKIYERRQSQKQLGDSARGGN